MKNYRPLIIKIALIICILAIILLSYVLYEFSFQVAEEYPELSYMRLPMFILCMGVSLFTIIAIIFAFLALLNYEKNQIFTIKLYKNLKNISKSLYIAIIFEILIHIYSQINVPYPITNFFVKIVILFYFILSQIFLLIADIIYKGEKIKKDWDLTI